MERGGVLHRDEGSGMGYVLCIDGRGRGVKQNGVERDIVYTSTDGREGVSKITIIIGIEHYTPTSPLH